MTDGRTVVVTHPISSAGVTPLSNLIEILREVSSNLCLITGDEGLRAFRDAKDIEVHGIISHRSTRAHKRVMNFIRNQAWISLQILRTAKDARNVVFFTGGDYLLAPILVSRLMGKRTVLVLVGSSHTSMRSYSDQFAGVIELVTSVVCTLATKIVTHSAGSISELGLARFEDKVTLCRRHFVRIPRGVNVDGFDERASVIGYVGRLAPEKGIMNLVEAMPSVLRTEDGLKVVICGDGMLREKVVEYAQANLPPEALEVAGWVAHGDLPRYMARMRLLVLPSDIEGVPNVMLEAMACGTAVLATPVGAVPDIIADGRNGFILKDNGPETIAVEVVRALHHPELASISATGREYVEKEFGFEQTIAPWRKVLDE